MAHCMDLRRWPQISRMLLFRHENCFSRSTLDLKMTTMANCNPSTNLPSPQETKSHQGHWHAVHRFLFPAPWPSLNEGATVHTKSLWSTSISDDYTFHTKVSVEMCSSEDWVYEELWMIHSGCKSNHQHLEQSLLTEDAPQMCSHWWNERAAVVMWLMQGLDGSPTHLKHQAVSKSVCWCHWHCLRSQREWGRALSNPNKEVKQFVNGHTEIWSKWKI